MVGDYEVGYGRPPRHTRFPKGKSGNPKGRPKGSRNLRTELLEELQERIVVREGGQSKRVSKRRAVFKSLTARALKGDAKATALLLELDRQIEERVVQIGGAVMSEVAVDDVREQFVQKIMGISQRLKDHPAAEGSEDMDPVAGDATEPE